MKGKGGWQCKPETTTVLTQQKPLTRSFHFRLTDRNLSGKLRATFQIEGTWLLLWP